MSERILRVVKDTTPEKNAYQDGFDAGYARGVQQATEYYSQEILSLHAQIFKLQQERSGNDQAPSGFVSLLDRFKANGNLADLRLLKSGVNEPVFSTFDDDGNEFF